MHQSLNENTKFKKSLIIGRIQRKRGVNFYVHEHIPKL